MKTTCYTLIALLYTATLFAQTTPPPRLGLTLGGGGAKGLAHVGVLQVLEANGIFPDYVTGTSMGSIVGGLYSIGYTPQELEDFALGLDWNVYFSDVYARHYLPIQERDRADRYQLSFALENGKLTLPKGLLKGTKIATLLSATTAPVHCCSNYDDFYRPFRCVAADLATGEGYVFSNGPLMKGLRASMSIPSAFEPVTYDEHLLADGMLARNLPVEDAFEMGADIVLAVDVGSPLLAQEEINSVVKIMEQTSSYCMAASTAHQRSIASFLIDPDLTGYSSLSYGDADSIIQRGVRAAEAALPALQFYLDSVGWQAQPIPERPRLQRDSFYVERIVYYGPDSTTQRTLRQLTRIPTPSILTLAELDERISLLYASGFFATIDFLFLPTDRAGIYELHLSAESRPDRFLRGSINYDTDLGIGLLLNYTSRNRPFHGGLFQVDARVSEFPGLWLDYARSTRTAASIGLNVYTNGQIIPGLTFDNNRVADRYTFHNYQVGAAIQLGLGRDWYVRTGIEGEHFSQNPRYLTLSEVDARAQHWQLFGQIRRDTYDRTYFPREGSLWKIWGNYNLAGRYEAQGEPTFTRSTNGLLTIGGKLRKVFRLHRNWWFDGELNGGYVNERNPLFLQQFYVGRDVMSSDRFFEFYGLRLTQVAASEFATILFQLRTEVGENNFVSLGYNYGRVS
ncbi:MAG: patatin-like phospholipase family protein [Bacteroidota bacterium]